MPFKLHLKKSCHYNVVSKSLFVISVELLDGTTIECSLSAESQGSDCLEYVCQRLGLIQHEFFGLCYMSKHQIPKWVELDRPLKRQIDKHAKDSNLYLRVMYYINKVSLIHDETTRYHFFLQVKKDVIDGKISCSVEQAVQLASFSMQAEFGNHDNERHTAEYLKDFVIFPEHVMEQSHMGLFEAVVQHHAALAGLSQSTAEEYYIVTAQQLDGYGHEMYLCLDDHKNQSLISVCLTGITAVNKFYQWKNITNVINHKKQFGIECQVAEDSCQFEFSDPELAKYVWKLCVLQHTFFMQTEQQQQQQQQQQSNNSESRLSTVKTCVTLAPSVNNFYTHSGDSRLVVDAGDQWSKTVARAQSSSCLDLTTHTDVDRLRALLPTYRQAPDYETAMQHPGRSHHPQVGLLYSSQPEIHQTHVAENVNVCAYRGHFPDVTQVYVEDEPQRLVKELEPQQISLHTYSAPELDTMDGQMLAGFQVLQLYKAPPPYRDPTIRPNSNSTPDLATQVLSSLPSTFINDQVSGSSPDLVSSRNMNHLCRLEQHFHPNPEAHRTYTNLAAVDQLTKPTPVEPIYENVPLPWREQENVESVMEQQQEPVPPPSLPVVTTTAADTTPTNTSVLDSSSLNTGRNNTNEQIKEDLSDQKNNNNSIDMNGKGKTWKKWALLGKGKSSTLQKTKPNSVPTSRDQPHRWSTGLPRLPLPPTVSKENMCQLLEWKLADSQLFYEFEKIPKKKQNCDVSVATHADNVSRNRYKDVLPYDENRVRLTPTKDNKSGYVNASHITATVGNNQRFYVASQSPMSNTCNAFWQTVWETDVYLVVRLTTDEEDALVSYLPSTCSHSLQYGEFQIWKEFVQETGHCITSRLRLFHNTSRCHRRVWHLQYTDWGEHGCPVNVNHFLGFLEELNSVRQHTISDIPAGYNRNPPVLVHCSAGVGRTGVTIVCDLLLHTLDHNQEVDIPRIVALLRHQRMLMVQTVAQYRFIYNLLINYLKQSRLI